MIAAQLATHYFGKNKKEDSLKALVLIGSVGAYVRSQKENCLQTPFDYSIAERANWSTIIHRC